MTMSADFRHVLVDVADRFGTPTYVYDLTVVERQVRRLVAAFPAPEYRLLYALKANPLPEIVRLLVRNGLGIDAVSPGERELALRLGLSPADILFSANNMSEEEMTGAHDSGVLLNIGELTRLEAFAHAYPGADVCVRFNPRIGSGHHDHVVTGGEQSKFGIAIEEADEVARICRDHRLRVRGIHQHIGSGNLDISPYAQSISSLLSTAGLFRELEFVNVGGGLGVPYRPSDSEFDLMDFRMMLDGLRADLAGRTGQAPVFRLEPGRYLTAQAGVLLVRVTTIKTSYGKTFVGTNSGMNHLVRPAMYGAYHTVENLTNPAAPQETYDIVGNICESADFFARDRDVAAIAEGDVLAILDVGAYGMSMASTYNLRELPTEVVIQVDGQRRCVRRRATPSEMVDRLLKETSGSPDSSPDNANL